jgi:hypothetical protein
MRENWVSGPHNQIKGYSARCRHLFNQEYKSNLSKQYKFLLYSLRWPHHQNFRLKISSTRKQKDLVKWLTSHHYKSSWNLVIKRKLQIMWLRNLASKRMENWLTRKRRKTCLPISKDQSMSFDWVITRITGSCALIMSRSTMNRRR